MNYTYIVLCNDGSLYTGWTTDLDRRISTHNRGEGARYTRSRLPVRLVYYEEYETKQEAMSREARIKRLTREEKLKLVEGSGFEHGFYKGIKAVSEMDRKVPGRKTCS